MPEQIVPPKKKRAHNFIEIPPGSMFGRWTVLREAEPQQGKAFWWCRCSCGTEKPIRARNLRRGHTRSCGCLTRERVSDTNTTHGLFGTPEYRSWSAMRQRCLSEYHPAYKRYGGRIPPITICERWLHSVENFVADMGPRPPGMTLDRIDSRGNYEPQNCRWLSPRDQIHNRRLSPSAIAKKSNRTRRRRRAKRLRYLCSLFGF